MFKCVQKYTSIKNFWNFNVQCRVLIKFSGNVFYKMKNMSITLTNNILHLGGHFSRNRKCMKFFPWIFYWRLDFFVVYPIKILVYDNLKHLKKYIFQLLQVKNWVSWNFCNSRKIYACEILILIHRRRQN